MSVDCITLKVMVAREGLHYARALWQRRIITLFFPALLGAAYRISQLMAGVEVVQQFGFTCAIIFWLGAIAFFSLCLLLHRLNTAAVALTPLFVFIFLSYLVGLFGTSISFFLDFAYFKMNHDKFLNAVKTSGKYINDSDMYSAPERTINSGGDSAELGKLIVFQEGYIAGWQRLIVYDESGQVEDQETSRRYIGQICVPRQGWKEGRPLLCATDNKGELLMGGSRKIKVKRIYGNFFSVYIEE